MQKTIYICLITLFCSLSAFAGTFDEYGYNNSSYGSPMYNTGAMGGGTYWSQLASDFYTQSNAVNPYSYSQTVQTKIKTSDTYTVSDTKPVETPTTIVVKYVSPSTGWDMWKIYPATTITSTQEKTVSTAEANTSVLSTYGPNTYFNFNVYNPVQQNYTYNTYQATTNGPVLVASAVQSGAPPLSAPYNAIPRTVSTGSLDASPGSKFQTAIALYNQQTLTLSEANKVIVDFIDRVIPDAPNGRVQFVGNVISKVASGLPPAQNGNAGNLLTMYMQLQDPTVNINDLLAITDYLVGKPMPYSSDVVNFTKDIIKLAKEETDLTNVNQIRNIVVAAKKNNYFESDFNQNFELLIDPYIDFDLSNPPSVETTFMVHFIVECGVLKRNHPTWSKSKILWEASKIYIHTSLDAFGLVPVYGEAADLTNGVLYTIEGDGLNATLSYASAVPILGWVSATTKAGVKIINVASDVTSKVKLVWKVEGGLIKFGERSQLRKVLGLIVGDVRQAHHIIPWNKQSKLVIQKASKSQYAFHMNEAINGIPLSTTIHSGSHAHYDELIQGYLDRVPANATPDQCYQAVNDIINKVRSAINNNPGVHINQLNF